jgi:hypothetical protein
VPIHLRALRPDRGRTGLDPQRYRSSIAGNEVEREFQTLESQISDAERFRDATPLTIRCRRCQVESALGGLNSNEVSWWMFTLTRTRADRSRTVGHDNALWPCLSELPPNLEHGICGCATREPDPQPDCQVLRGLARMRRPVVFESDTDDRHGREAMPQTRVPRLYASGGQSQLLEILWTPSLSGSLWHNSTPIQSCTISCSISIDFSILNTHVARRQGHNDKVRWCLLV